MAAPMLRWGCKSSRNFLASMNKRRNNALFLSVTRQRQSLKAVREIHINARRISASIISKPCRTFSTLQPSRRFSSDSEGDYSRKRSLKLMDFPLIYELPWSSPMTMVRNWLFTLLIRGYFDQEFTWANFQQGAVEAVRVVSTLLGQGNLQGLEELVENKAISEIATNYEKLHPEDLPEFDSYATRDLSARIHEIRIIMNDETVLVSLTNISEERYVEITTVFASKPLLSANFESSQDLERFMNNVRHNTVVCNCRFLRNFTKGIENSDWIIDKLNYFYLSEVF